MLCAMLLIAAILTIAVSLMHSVLGERRLIGPLLRREDLPVILGSLKNTRLTLRIAWHITSLMWWGIAAVLAYMHVAPETASVAFLWMVSAVFGVSGAAALVASRGKHRSWVFFLPIAVLTGYAAYTA